MDERYWLLVAAAPLLDYAGLSPVGDALLVAMFIAMGILFWRRLEKLDFDLYHRDLLATEERRRLADEAVLLCNEVRKLSDRMGTRFVP